MTEATPITVSAVAININQTYDSQLSAEELYDYTRGVWRLDRDRAEKAKYAFAVYSGTIVEVYEIQRWHRAGNTEYLTGRVFSENEKKTRFEFIGQLASEEVRNKFVGKTLPEPHSQNPIKYYKC